MAKFKKIKIAPIRELGALNLNIAEEKHYDVSDLPEEAQRTLMSQLMEIARQSEGVVVAKPVDGKQHVAAVVRPSKQKDKTFSFPEPNPIHLYFDIAVAHLEKAENLKQQFFEAANTHPQAEFELFCSFFQEIVPGIVFLLMTVEGFMNQLAEENKTYTINNSEKTKKDIEWMPFTDKLRQAVPVLTGVDFYVTNRPAYDRLQLLNSLRDDLIHLKKLEQANFTFYQELFKRLFDFPLSEGANAVFEFITTLKQDFFHETQ